MIKIGILPTALINKIDGLEYKGDRFILGVQWHPELEEDNIVIFQKLVNEAGKR